MGNNIKIERFIGTSRAMQEIYDKISKIAPTDTTVFIGGESGTGKEICAKTLHDYSARKDKPFIALNCGALSKDLIESALFGHVQGAFTGALRARDGAIHRAEGGTLFLDEIGDMPLDVQIKLLRFCQDFSYSKLGSDTSIKANIRLICASNQDLKKLILTGQFREDLYYRLYIAPIIMPPLRDRQDDVLDIANYYLSAYAKIQHKNIQSFSENAQKLLSSYHWPGNVRELQNIVQRIVTFENTPVILASMLPQQITANYKKHKKETDVRPLFQATVPLWKIEKKAIENAIALTNGNIPQAATLLDVAPSTIYRKIKLWEKSK